MTEETFAYLVGVVVILSAVVVGLWVQRDQARRREQSLRTELAVLEVSREGLQSAYHEAAKVRDFYREDNLNMHRRYDGVECLTVEARQSIYASAQAAESRVIEDLAAELVKQVRPHIFIMRGIDVGTGELTYIATLNLYNKRGELPHAGPTIGRTS